MIRVILFLLFSFGLVADAPPKKEYKPLGAWPVLLDGVFKALDNNVYTYYFDSDKSLLTANYKYEDTEENYAYSFIEEQFIVTIYRSEATCVYNKKMIGSVLHLIMNDSSTGNLNRCDYSYQLIK